MISNAVLNSAKVLAYLEKEEYTAIRDKMVRAPQIGNAIGCHKNRYLEQFMQKMGRRGWIKSKKGPVGGYCITEKGVSLTLRDFLREFVEVESWWQLDLLEEKGEVSYRRLVEAETNNMKEAA